MKIETTEIGVPGVVEVDLPRLMTEAIQSAVVLWAIHEWGEDWLLLPIASTIDLCPLTLTATEYALISAAAKGGC